MSDALTNDPDLSSCLKRVDELAAQADLLRRRLVLTAEALGQEAQILNEIASPRCAKDCPPWAEELLGQEAQLLDEIASLRLAAQGGGITLPAAERIASPLPSVELTQADFDRVQRAMTSSVMARSALSRTARRPGLDTLLLPWRVCAVGCRIVIRKLAYWGVQ